MFLLNCSLQGRSQDNRSLCQQRWENKGVFQPWLLGSQQGELGQILKPEGHLGMMWLNSLVFMD